MTNHRPTDRQITTRAIELLNAGLLPSALPAQLMAEFSLTPEKARELAGKAIQQRKKEQEPSR